MPNYNTRTGIPFGVISSHAIDSDLLDELWYTHGEDMSYKAALEELREEITKDVENENDDRGDDPWTIEEMADEVDRRLERAAEHIEIDEPTIAGEYEGVSYTISWLGGAPLVWIFESPVTGKYARCSPCVPGAGDLDTPDENGIECYDVPADWRRNDQNH